MKRALLLVLTGITVLTLQTTLLASHPINKIRPDLLLILVLYLGFSFPLISGGLLAFFIGYLTDVFSGNTFGLYCFTRSLVFFAAQLSRSRFYWEGISFQSLFVFVFAVIEGLVALMLLWALNPTPLRSLYSWGFPSLLLQSLFTAACTPPFFSLFNKGVAFILQRFGYDLKGSR